MEAKRRIRSDVHVKDLLAAVKRADQPNLARALAPGECWITIHAPEHEKRQPILIKEQPDGSFKVIGGADGSLNYLRLDTVRSSGRPAWLL